LGQSSSRISLWGPGQQAVLLYAGGDNGPDSRETPIFRRWWRAKESQNQKKKNSTQQKKKKKKKKKQDVAGVTEHPRLLQLAVGDDAAP